MESVRGELGGAIVGLAAMWLLAYVYRRSLREDYADVPAKRRNR